MADRVIAFLDVLGFSQLVENVEHQEMIELYRKLLRAGHDETMASNFPDDRRRFEQEPFFDESEILMSRRFSVLMASDSILLYSDGDAFLDALAVTYGVIGLLAAGFRLGMPLRGGIARGEFDILDEDFDRAHAGPGVARSLAFVGRGAVRAVDAEERCEWSGAVLHPELVEHLKALVVGTASDGEVFAWDYMRAVTAEAPDVPQKSRSDPLDPCCAVNWPFPAAAANLTGSDVILAFESHGMTLDARAEQKRKSTLDFWQEHSRGAGSRSDDLG